MKKILTLFVMLLCGWSIVSAQAPVFGYQAVVRTTADSELVANATVDVAIQVMDENQQALYSETQTGKHTDNLGMLSILVGTGSSSSTTLNDIDWTKATTIHATVTANGKQIEINSPVCAVPYALKSGSSKLTTEQIVNYLSNDTIGMDDYEAIMAAVVDNDNGLWQAIKAKVVEYLKAHKDKSLDLASYYLAHATKEEFDTLYTELKTNNKDVYDALVEKAKQYALENKGFAVQVLQEYVAELTTDEVNEVYDAIVARQADWKSYAQDFAKTHRNFVVSTMEYFLRTADRDEIHKALVAFQGSDMEETFVKNYFYPYLDAYLPTLNNSHIPSANTDVNAVNTAINGRTDLNGYLKKVTCQGENQPVDVCKIASDVEQMKAQ